MRILTHTISTGVDAARLAGPAASVAQDLLRSTTTAGVTDLRRLAGELAEVAAQDRARAADLVEEIAPKLGDADKRALSQEFAEAADANAVPAKPAAASSANGAGTASLLLDLTQIGLSIAGFFDPTPLCDGLDGLISLMRGDYVGAGISAVSMIPYLGDAAKLGKLGKFGDVIVKAADLARIDPSFARRIAPKMDEIRDLLRADADVVLPKAIRGKLDEILESLDDFTMRGRPAARADAFDRHELRRIFDQVGDNADQIDDMIGPTLTAIERQVRTGARDLDAGAQKRIRELVEALRPDTFADLVDSAGERSVLHDLFAAAERNVSRRPTMRAYETASREIGQQLARLNDLEDALVKAKGRKRSEIVQKIDDLLGDIDLNRQVLQDRFSPRGAYETIRNEMYRLARERGIEWPDDVPIHHLIPIHEAPELATHPANLLLVRAGADGSHDLIHEWLRGVDSNKWAGFSPDVLAAIRAALDL